MKMNFYPKFPEFEAMQVIRELEQQPAKDTAENTASIAKALQEMTASLEAEKLQRAKADAVNRFLSIATLVIALLTLLATIAVPLMS